MQLVRQLAHVDLFDISITLNAVGAGVRFAPGDTTQGDTKTKV